MKTTLVKERIYEIIYDNFYGHSLTREIETATQALEALVNDECIKARINEVDIMPATSRAETLGYKLDRIRLLNQQFKERNTR